MPRTLQRASGRLRLWSPGEVIAGREPEESREMGLEFVGFFEPPRYGLLGGYLAEGSLQGTFSSSLDVDVPFVDNLVGHGEFYWGEHFLLGLPQEYRQGIAEAAPAMWVTKGGHGEVSSSAATFNWLARVLAAALELGDWPGDESVWSLLDANREGPGK